MRITKFLQSIVFIELIDLIALFTQKFSAQCGDFI